MDLPLHRRSLLLAAAAGLGLAPASLQALGAAPAPAPDAGAPPGKVGEFNFLAGTWKIRHRRPKGTDGTTWDEFSGEATCWTVLGGAGSIEELRIPSRNFSGLGIRLLDQEKHLWTDFWVSGSSGVLAPPGTTGSFQDGVGTFVADDVDGQTPIKVRGVWDRITPTSCRWSQAISRDGGATWREDWVMHWVRG